MSGMFGGGGKSTSEERYTGLQLQTSSYAKPIPLGYGTAREPPNLLWYGSFVATSHTEKMGGKGGGGGGSHTTYTYQAAVVMGLCEGGVAGIGTVWAEKEQTTLSALGFTLFTGGAGQSTWSFLTTNHPSQAIPYSATAHVAAGALQLGNTPALPNLNFEIQFNIRHNPGGGIIDAEPSVILDDYLANPLHGANFPHLHGGSISGPNNWRTYCISMGYFLSPVEKTQRPAVEFVDEMCRITNAAPLWSEGVLKIIPYADAPVSGNGESYTPDLTPLYSLTDDDYMPDEGEDPVIVDIKPPSETFNVVRIEFLDRALQYNTNVAEAKDDQDIALRGLRVMPTIKFESIKDMTVARQVAQTILQRQLHIRREFKFRVRADYCLLEGMDVIEINEGDDIVDQLALVMEVEDDEDDRLTFIAEELPVGPGGAPKYDWQLAQGYSVNYAASPGNVNTPAIINTPRLLADAANGGYEVWIAVSGANSNWGGCEVLVSLDNVQYQYAGRIHGPARYGTLTASIGAGADPDTSSTLAILLNNTNLDLVSGSAADADNLRTLIWFDGEVGSFQTATLTGPGAYNLTYLRRGKYGTTRAAHSSGTRFIRLDPAVFRLPYDPGLVGQTVYFKFRSFNIYGFGLQDVAGLTSYSHVLNAFGPTGENAAESPGTVFLETWDFQNWELYYNNRVNGGGLVVTYPSDGELGGRVLQAAGAQMWIAHKENVPYDPNALYRITTRLRRTVAAANGQSRAFIGVEGVAADGVTLINQSGIDSASSQHYNCVRDLNLGNVTLGEWVTSTGYFRGHGTTKFGPQTNISDPATLYTGVRYIRPLLILNYDNGNGAQQCDYVRIDVINPTVGANLLQVGAWTAGAIGGRIGNFVPNESTAGENQIINGTGPFGVSQLLWECRCADPGFGTGGQANGGWENIEDLTGLDAAKTYRSVVWVRRRVAGTNDYYHGCIGSGETLNLDGSTNANPYFVNFGLGSLTVDRYYLSVGIIHGSGYSGGQSGLSGVWDPVTGQRVISGTDFKMAPSARRQMHRVYMYYGGDTTTRMDLADPRFEIVDGTEPSILSLLGVVGTGMLSPNAATDPIYQAENAAALVLGSTLSVLETDVLSVAFTPQTAGEAKLTATCTAQKSASGGAPSSVYLDLYLDSTRVDRKKIEHSGTLPTGHTATHTLTTKVDVTAAAHTLTLRCRQQPEDLSSPASGFTFTNRIVRAENNKR